MALRGAMTGGNAGATTTTTDATLTFPAGTTAGDVAVVVCSQNFTTTTMSTPSGWTLLAGPTDSTTNMRAYMFGKVLNSTDVATGTVTLSASLDQRRVSLGAVFSGVSGFGTPAEVSSGSASSLTTPTVTTGTSGSDVFSAITYRRGTVPMGDATWPAGWTEIVEGGSNLSGANAGASIAKLTTPGAAGSYGGVSVTFSQSNQLVGFTVALTPAAIPSGSATGTTSWAGSATGQKVMAGVAAGALVWAGTAAGSTLKEGTAAGSTSWVGSAAGTTERTGMGAGATAWSGTAEGAAARSGSATGATGWAGSASGSTTTSGTASGSTNWAGAASGIAPVVDSHSGSAAGATSWNGGAVGVTVTSGVASGATDWAGIASGAAPSIDPASGETSGTTTWVGTATGRAPGEDDGASVPNPGLTLTLPTATLRVAQPDATTGLTVPAHSLTLTVPTTHLELT